MKENETYFLEATPWVGCPFKLYLVVITCEGKEDAIQVMRETFKNDGLIPDRVEKIAVVKGKINEEAERANTPTA